MSRNEDVIELGSSDEEIQPAPRKQKPPPNAMVHIPHKLPGITIGPAKSSSSKMIIPSKKITVRNLEKLQKPMKVKVVNDNKSNNNSSSVSDTSNRRQIPTVNKKTFPIGIHGRKVLKSGIPIINKQTLHQPGKQVIYPALNPNSFFSQPLHMKQKLPPSLTIKRCKSNQNTNLPQVRRLKVQPPKAAEVLTVELDDDDMQSTEKSPPPRGPQWYRRPEEDNDLVTEEEQNNTEPSPSKMIEITIEDSPVKPLSKKGCEVGSEYAVTIEDSPVRNKAKRKTPDSDENSPNKKEYHSKKKLRYPDISKSKEVVEVEIVPIVVQPANKETSNLNNEGKSIAMETIEIEESPMKPIEAVENNTPKKIEEQNKATGVVQPMKVFTKTEVETKTVPIKIEDLSTNEFHSTYQSFIDMCFKLENSEDMKKIVEKKIKAYYLQVPKSYTESEEFLDMVAGKVISMKASPDKMYLYIKDVVDELNLQRKMAKNKVEVKDEKSLEVENFLYGEESQFDSKRKRQIKKLEKTLKKLHRAIQKLEEQEVDFDDEEDSVYLLTDRYKERMVKVHAKLCQLTNTKMPSEPRVHIEARPGQPTGPARRLEKWINRKVPIGTPLPFPDFHDVLRCVKDANEQDNLGWNDVDIMEEARDLFTRCGKKLQRRRQENEWRLAMSRIPADVDPAETSEELKRKLNENRQSAAKKETEVFNKFADKQKQLNLEAVEIGDKEAEESPADSEDEEANDEGEALEDKEKRKDRIKRLLQEKSKKTAIDKEERKQEKVGTDENVVDADPEQADTDDIPKDKENAKSASVKKPEESGKLESEDNVPKKADDDVNEHSDSSKIDSDIDELHLLQKLHSSNEVNYSSGDTSNSESPIDISDTLDSSSDDENKPKSDEIISIENSSYSESEAGKDIDMDNIETEYNKKSETTVNETNDVQDKQIDNEETVDEVGTEAVLPKEDQLQTMEFEYTPSGNARKIVGVELSAEEILLASSSEEDGSKINSPNSECMNANDDAMSIGETCVEFENNSEESDKTKNVNKTSVNDDNSLDVTILSDNSEHKNNDESSQGSNKDVDITTVIDSEDILDENETLRVKSDKCFSSASSAENNQGCVSKDKSGGDKTNNIESKKTIDNGKINDNFESIVENNVTNKVNSSLDSPVECSKNTDQAVDSTSPDASPTKSTVEIVSAS